jgi:hypothetical protein
MYAGSGCGFNDQPIERISQLADVVDLKMWQFEDLKMI